MMNKPPPALIAPDRTQAVSLRARVWRIPSLNLALLFCAIVYIFWDTFAALVGQWTSSTAYNHSFLIPLLAGYLVFERRAQLADLRPVPTWSAMLLVLSLVALWLVGRVANAQIVEQFAVTMIVQSAVIAILGWRVARALAFPLFFLFFAVPFGDFLVPDLQIITAKIIVEIISWSTIPIYSQGVLISLPNGDFEVAEICSGLRFLLASVAIGSLMANLMLRQTWRRLVFMAAVFLVPLIGNGLRAYGIVMLAYLSDNEIATGVDHIVYGWVFVSLILLALLGFGVLLRDPEEEADEAALTMLATSPEDNGGTYQGPAPLSVGQIISSMLVSLTILVMLAGGTVVAQNVLRPPDDTRDQPLASLGVQSGWTATTFDEKAWRPAFPGADVERRASFQRGDRRIDTVTAYYHWQREGAEVVSWNNKLAADKKWHWLGQGSLEVNVDGHPLTLPYSLYQDKNTRRSIAHFYWVAGEKITEPRLAKILQVKAALFGPRIDAAAVVLSTEYTHDPKAGLATLRDFLRDVTSFGLP